MKRAALSEASTRQAAGEKHRLIGDKADRVPVQPANRSPPLRANFAFQLEKITIVNNRFDDLIDVVGALHVLRDDVASASRERAGSSTGVLRGGSEAKFNGRKPMRRRISASNPRRLLPPDR